MNDERECEYCHVNLPQRPRRGGQPKRFCSNRCRLAAHTERHKKKMRWLTEHASYEGEECLVWPFGRTTYGYAGSILRDSRYEAACRVMCKLAHGPPPTPNHETAHSGKGTEGCINPKHLRWATGPENASDRELHRALRLESSEESKNITDGQETLAAELLKGADEIAAFLYGDPERRREIYSLNKADRKRLGLFHIGRVIHGTRSRIREGVARMADAGK